MRILHIIDNKVGGIYRVVTDITATLDSNEFQQGILVIGQEGEPQLRSDGARELPFPLAGNMRKVIAKLAALMKEYDIVHLHGYTPWVASAARRSGRRLVLTNHGLLGVGRKLRLYEYIKQRMAMNFIRRHVHAIANISRYAQQKIVSVYNVSESKCAVVYNCTRWERNVPSVAPLQSPVLGFHGRFVGFKRLDRLIEVAAEVRKHMDVRVALVGGGPLKEEIEQKAKALGVLVDVTDYTEDITAAIRNFDIAVLPSDDEYFGISALESIQAGLPTFVFADGGGCTEIFDDETAWFVCRTIAEMAEKVASMENQRVCESVQAMLAKLQARVETVFSPKRFAEGYATVYRGQ